MAGTEFYQDSLTLGQMTGDRKIKMSSVITFLFLVPVSFALSPYKIRFGSKHKDSFTSLDFVTKHFSI